MCGRWYVDLMADDELALYYEKLKNKEGIKAKGEVYPTDHVMVIANNKELNPSVFNMKWGYTVGKNIVFNARCETLRDKLLFQDGILNRRCVIPANAYFEWDKSTKAKNIIKDSSSDIIYFLGIYRFENDSPVCSIITKNASEEMESLHPRMPVIIHKDKVDEWLSCDCNIDQVISSSINNLEYGIVQ